ncbi:MAG: hypothetical protein ACOYY2_03800, partial [Actinomycetota bacterium]
SPVADLGPDAWVARVELRYRLAQADQSPVLGEQLFTMVRRGGTWYVAGDAGGAAAPGAVYRGLWDYGPVVVARGRHALVLGLGSADRLRPFVTLADAAVPAVSSTWGTAWPEQVVLVVPQTLDQMAGLLGGTTADYQQIAAVTTGQAASGARGESAERIVLNPDAFARLGAVGRRVVLTHEVTHVATRAATDATMPMWLAEGFADYVGYRGTGIPVRVAAGDLLRQVRAGQVPATLPVDGAFDGRSAGLSAAYEQAWLAALFIAERYGPAKLVAFYQAVGTRPDLAPDVAVEQAAGSVLGTTVAGLTAGWRAYLRAQAR